MKVNKKSENGIMRNSFENLSVIVQGGIDNVLTARCMESIRKQFPNAEIILSTWENSNATGLVADKVVFSPDPGAVYCDEVAKILNNVNRQLVSTKAGIEVATRPFILKTRTDIMFHSADFLSYFGKFDGVPSKYFHNRLLICDNFTRNPRVICTCFHPSDWIVFGRAEDVRDYYRNIPLMTQEDGDWFRNRKKEFSIYTNLICRFTPEQHIFLGYLKQKEFVNCKCYYDHRVNLVVQTERAFAECFVVLDYQKQLDIEFLKYNPNRYKDKYTLISHWQWKALYQHYCLSSVSILWVMYCALNCFLLGVSVLRTFLIRVLDCLGLKETVKRFLRGRQ